MNINIKLNKNFTSQFNKLSDKYGEELAYLNGFGDNQLSYTDFIDNFIDKNTVADASVDSNSNVSHKDIVTLEREMPKPHSKLIAANKIFYELQKKYGFKTACEWFEAEWTGQLYMHDFCSASYRHYCFAYDLKDLAEKGLYFIDGQNPCPAKHLSTFVDFVKEFVSFACNRSSGAVGLPNLIPYMFYFWKKDVDEGYVVRDPKYYAKQSFQRFIYAVNQPYVRDGSQSAFTNTSVFDRPYFEALFGGAVFPDGSFMIDYEEEIIEFQKWYMETMSDIRSQNMFTFPVSTISLLRKEGEYDLDSLDGFVDPEFAEWAIKHNMKWSDSNFFLDTSVDSLSNCCFDGSQMTLTKSSDGVNYMSFKDLYEASWKEYKRNFTIFHNGCWVQGKPVRMPKRNLYRITTANNKEIIVTDNHINVTQRGDVQTADLTTDDYLMFNNSPLYSVKEVDKHLSYNQGFLIGMYLGDGSMYNEEEDNRNTEVNLSINIEKYESSINILNAACDEIETKRFSLSTLQHNTYPLKVRDNKLAEFIRMFVSGKYAFEKRLNLDCLLQSYEFRKGILDGYYLTDGGNSNRIYTTSSGLVNDIEALMTSLGLQSIINISDRIGEGEVVIRGESFNRNYPLYCIRWYEPTNRRKMKDIYIKRNNSIFYKIVNICEYNPSDEYVYCFEMKDQDEPYFTLPNGIITHNCRLKSNISDLGYFNSIGGAGLKVGSIKVSTINLARLALDTNTEEEYLEELHNRTLLDLQALDVVRYIIKRNVEKGLLPNFIHGLVDFEHLYNTIGFIGIYETMKKFGYTTMDEFGNTYYTDKAAEFGDKIFKTMRSTTDEFLKEINADYKVSTEQIPGENSAAKLMQKDKYFYPNANIYDLPLYGNQFIPLGIQTTLQERIRIQALFDGFCNGGSILHCNIDAPFDSYEKALKMTNYLAQQGVTYSAYNTRIQACKNNHAFYGKICPVCGEPVDAEYTRIVGFYTKIKDWSKERKAEYKLRRWGDINNETQGIS